MMENHQLAVDMNSTERINSDRRIVVRHKDLAEIVAAISEYFDKAAAAGEQVSEMLDRSLKQLKMYHYHYSGVLSNLSSSWTSKPPLSVKEPLFDFAFIVSEVH